MRQYNKPPITIDQQIETLTCRGLKVEDKKVAHDFLSRVSYYRLRAYTYPYQNNDDPNHPFIVDVSFEDIVDDYLFDHRLRLLVMDAISTIEIALRTQIIYHFSLEYGSHWYLNRELYRTIKVKGKSQDTRQNSFDAKLKDPLKNEIERSKEGFIKHYIGRYDKPKLPPAWMALEVITFGKLSRIFQNLKYCQQKSEVTSYFGLKSHKAFEKWLYSISDIRNICAHHSRLWNRKFLVRIDFKDKFQNTFIKHQGVLPDKLYAALSVIGYMLGVIEPENTFKENILQLMINASKRRLKATGFPTGWREDPFWHPL